MTESYLSRETTDRARGWISIPPGHRFGNGMAMARDARRGRAQAAARRAIAAAWSLAGNNISPAGMTGDPAWELRGEPRTRQTFGLPHPGDFTGGLPLPAR